MSALETLRVLDMTQYEAGTSCTQALAWLGADVVKVEPPRGDPGRGVSQDPTVVSQYFLNYNSNKKSLAINLKSEQGRELFLGLVPKFDAFIENYAPGVMESLGLTYDVLSAVNPGLIYGRIKGFGLSGPYSDYSCYDWVALAAAGAYSVTGTADGPPMTPGVTCADSGTGLQMALAVTAAYVQKQRTGRGQFIEISMQEAVTMFMKTQGLAGWGQSAAPRNGNRRGPTINVYPCAPGGPNDHIMIAAVTSEQWDGLCAGIERPELLADERFEAPANRLANADILYDEIAAWTRTKTKYEAMQHLASLGVPCSATLDTYELFTDPHLTSRHFIQTVTHASGKEVQLMRGPILMSDSHVPIKAAPLLGSDTDAVLTADGGFSADEIAKLRESGIVY
ncbi:hypothetical protein AYO38_07570 [bacterium SCGC AG-212-C10]|nr:hypothetical protein AYO38_07570 [bacterium SCGC AG-212-C10]